LAIIFGLQGGYGGGHGRGDVCKGVCEGGVDGGLFPTFLTLVFIIWMGT
jgi:hypothetical protein